MTQPQKSKPAAPGKMVIFTADTAPTLEETGMMDDPTYTEEGANDSPWPREFAERAAGASQLTVPFQQEGPPLRDPLGFRSMPIR